MKVFCFDGHVRGASHKLSGAPCQDASGTRTIDGSRGVATAIAVADGHGDPTCRRSDRGSHYAVEVALACLEELALEYLSADVESVRELRDRLLSQEDDERCKRLLAQTIVDRWCAATRADYEADPLEELAQAMEESDEAWRLKAIRRIYGTTLVCALMLPDLCVVVQQGDGCATVILCEGTEPLAHGDLVPKDELCIGNMTTSLSDSDAASRMRVVAIDRLNDPIAALFVGTDGIDKSLPRRDGASDLFAGIALDVLEAQDNDSWDEERFERDLCDLLDRVSQMGSGDDASVAAVIDFDDFAGIATRLQKERGLFGLQTALMADRDRLASMSRKYEYYLALDPPNDIVAHERQDYLDSYRKLENRIASLERDLAAEVSEGETGRERSMEASEESIAHHESDEEAGEVDAVVEPIAEAASESDVNVSVNVEYASTPAMAPSGAQEPSKRSQAPVGNAHGVSPATIGVLVVLIVVTTLLILVLTEMISVPGFETKSEPAPVTELVDEDMVQPDGIMHEETTDDRPPIGNH